MSGVWFVILPVALIALLFILWSVRKLGRSIGTLVASVQELSEVGVGLNKIRDDLAAMRAADDEIPPQ
ncbi:MAG: hypothetical protein QOE93_2084 [Actinomycetota bacterium]|jgi:hypothetical protein|nr:hypothetical protein [Actinomycetota bacterium]